MDSRSHLHAPGQRDTRRRYSKVGIFSLSLSPHHLPHHVQDGVYTSDLDWWCGIQSSDFCVECSVDRAPCQRDIKFSVEIRDLYIATSENKPGSSQHCLSGHRNQHKSQRIESHTCIINLPEDSRESLKPAQNVIEEVFIFMMIYL